MHANVLYLYLCAGQKLRAIANDGLSLRVFEEKVETLHSRTAARVGCNGVKGAHERIFACGNIILVGAEVVGFFATFATDHH